MKHKSKSKLVRIDNEAVIQVTRWTALTGKSESYIVSALIKHNLHGSLLAHFQALGQIQNVRKAAANKIATAIKEWGNKIKPI